MILTSRHFQRIARKTASLLALAAVVLSSLGVFLLPHTTPSGSGAYPCQGGTCGCASAEQCWRSCCCTTLSQRLTWAQRHGITPPKFVRQQVAAVGVHALDEKPKTCCSADSASCSEDSSPDECVAIDTGSAQSLPAQLVLISAVNRCRGLTAYIAIFGVAICEPIGNALIAPPVAGQWLMPAEVSFTSAELSPPTPPPRIVV